MTEKSVVFEWLSYPRQIEFLYNCCCKFYFMKVQSTIISRSSIPEKYVCDKVICLAFFRSSELYVVNNILQLHLSPNRKYQPRIHVVEETEEGVKVSCSTYVFPETTFIAVTTYQNEEVTMTSTLYILPPHQRLKAAENDRAIIYEQYFKHICNVHVNIQKGQYHLACLSNNACIYVRLYLCHVYGCVGRSTDKAQLHLAVKRKGKNIHLAQSILIISSSLIVSRNKFSSERTRIKSLLNVMI